MADTSKKPKRAAAAAVVAAANTANSNEEPRNARIIATLLQSMGVEEYDARVPSQLLEFMHRYVLEVFRDSLLYAEHCSRTEVTLEDVKLAIQAKVNHSFTTPPPREFTQELAAQRNRLPLPIINDRYGLRLPPERHCLTNVNYKVIPTKPSKSLPSPSTRIPPSPWVVATSSTLPSSAAPVLQANTVVPTASKGQKRVQEDDYDDYDNDDDDDESRKRKKADEL